MYIGALGILWFLYVSQLYIFSVNVIWIWQKLSKLIKYNLVVQLQHVKSNWTSQDRFYPSCHRVRARVWTDDHRTTGPTQRQMRKPMACVGRACVSHRERLRFKPETSLSSATEQSCHPAHRFKKILVNLSSQSSFNQFQIEFFLIKASCFIFFYNFSF